MGARCFRLQYRTALRNEVPILALERKRFSRGFQISDDEITAVPSDGNDDDDEDLLCGAHVA